MDTTLYWLLFSPVTKHISEPYVENRLFRFTVPKGRVHHDEEGMVAREVLSVAVRACGGDLMHLVISRSRKYEGKEPGIIYLHEHPLSYTLPPARPTSCWVAINSKINLLHGRKTYDALKRGETFHPAKKIIKCKK